jgi:AraC-like DNA-binding protein
MQSVKKGKVIIMKAKSSAADKITEYIDNHLSEELKLDQLAAVAGYSKYHMSRVFADKTGMTIHQYIQKKRLSKAAEQLIRTDQAIIDIAASFGYGSQQSFHLAFRNRYKQAPLAYRRKHQYKEMKELQKSIRQSNTGIQCNGIGNRMKGAIAA